MIITCKECNTRFNLDDKRVKPAGSKVRCAKCKTVFTVYPMSSQPGRRKNRLNPLL